MNMDFLEKELQNLKLQDRYRHLRRIEGPQGPTLNMNGRKMISFASNNYLGLANHPAIIKRAVEVVGAWGTGSGASRLISGNTALHERLEERIADFKGTDAAILFNTGFMANLGVLTSLMGTEDTIFSDELNHASIIDGARMSKAKIVVYKHRDAEDLETKLRTNGGDRKLVVSDGVFSMDGEITPLPGLVDLAEQNDAFLMVDDAHGTGVLGENGRGTSEHFHLSGGVDINMGTLSKAMGSEGGFIAGNENLINFLRNKARSFIYTTAMAPGSVGASLGSFDVLEEESWRIRKLHENASFMRDGLRKAGFRTPEGHTPIIPVIIGSSRETMEFSKRVEEMGIFVPGIRPPTVPDGKGRVRITVMATHTKEQLDRGLDAFEKVGRSTGIV